jgi:hypothetical protein
MFGEAPRNTTDSSLPCGLLWNVEGNNDGNAPEICRANNLQILHIFLVIEEKVTNPRGMMDTVAGGYECLIVFVHESCSSLKHGDNLKIGLGHASRFQLQVHSSLAQGARQPGLWLPLRPPDLGTRRNRAIHHFDRGCRLDERERKTYFSAC